MAFVPAHKSRVLADVLNLSCTARGFNTGFTVDMLDRTTLCDEQPVFQPGLDQSTFTVDLILDTDATAGGQWATLHGWKSASPKPFTVAPSGLTAGSEVLMVNANQSQLAITTTPTDLVTGSLQLTSADTTDIGVMLENLTAVTADGNGTARDNGAATSNGGVAHLHVTEFSGLTNNIVTIEHSVDGSTSWATLVTFATYTGTTSERVVVAPGTTVRRHLRVVDNVTGTGSTTRAVSFARR